MVHDLSILELEDRVRALAFRELLADGRPVSAEEVAAALGLDVGDLDAVLASLEARGWITRAADGAVTGSHGLSVVPTVHELDLNGDRRWTWCAWDAVSILAALCADGVVVSRTPLGQPIELRFSAGRPPQSQVVVFLPEVDCRSVVDEWCPLANFFRTPDDAERWSREHAAAGRIASLEQATEAGATMWRSYLEGGGG